MKQLNPSWILTDAFERISIAQRLATVATLRRKIDDETQDAFKGVGIMFKHKGKDMADLSARLSLYGVTDGSEVLLLITSESASVVGLPPMMIGHEFLPGEPVPKQKTKRQKSADGGDKKRERFSKEEAEDLIKGVDMYGLGQWAQIRSSLFHQTNRTGVDLKDKWRNLVLASERAPNFKFRVDYLNDQEFLRRVKTVNDAQLVRVHRMQF